MQLYVLLFIYLFILINNIHLFFFIWLCRIIIYVFEWHDLEFTARSRSVISGPLELVFCFHTFVPIMNFFFFLILFSD